MYALMWLTSEYSKVAFRITQNFGVRLGISECGHGTENKPFAFEKSYSLHGQRGIKRGAAEKMRGPAALGLKKFAHTDHHDIFSWISW